MTPTSQQNDRLDQALLPGSAVESVVSLWIEHSELSYNIRRFYTMPVPETGFTKSTFALRSERRYASDEQGNPAWGTPAHAIRPKGRW